MVHPVVLGGLFTTKGSMFILPLQEAYQTDKISVKFQNHLFN